MFSLTCEHGIRSLIYLAKRDDYTNFISIREISNDLDIPFHFLTKVLQKLTEAGIIESSRGAKGGIRFLKKPEMIKLSEIVFAIDGEKTFSKCLIGLNKCDELNPCVLHDLWMEPKRTVTSFLSESTLNDLIVRQSNDKTRI